MALGAKRTVLGGALPRRFVDFATLASHFDALEQTSGRLDMTRIMAQALAEAETSDLRPLILMVQGKLAPDWEGLEVGLAEKQMLIVLAACAGLDPARGGVEEATKVYHDVGDLGLAAERLLERKGGARQVGLMAFGAPEEAASLPVPEVHAKLLQIASISGSGSQDKKQAALRKLLADCSPLEARFIARFVAGRLRLGVADMTILDALSAWHLGRGVRSVQEMEPEERAEAEAVRATLEHAFDLRSDLALVADTLARDGLDAVRALGIAVGTPLRPMAAERMKTLPEIMLKQSPAPAPDGDGEAIARADTGELEAVELAGGPGVGMDYKYDGLRIQAHVAADGAVKLFSRRLEDLTSQFPDVVANLQASFPGRELIFEGEAVAVDTEGRLRPFQEISRRRGRKTALGGDDVTTLAGETGSSGAYDITKEIPITLFAFDLLALDGESRMGDSFEARRAALESLIGDGLPGVVCSTYTIASDVADMETFFQQAVAAGAEGIMCKQLDAPYKAGSRGFAWIKFKTDYTAELVDTMDLVCIGAFVGRGRRAGWYGALLMAAYDDARDRFASVCKLGTGFDDATLMGLRDRFAQFESAERPSNVDAEMVPDIWFHPSVVMEVQAAELSLSPIHRAAWGELKEGAGLAARFPRFTHWRDDKAPEQATTVGELRTMYGTQGKQGAA